jgi:undecaprenyl-diphosphatase
MTGEDITAARSPRRAVRLTSRVVLGLTAVLLAAVALASLVLAARAHSGAVHRLDIRLDDRINRFVHQHPGQTLAWKAVTDIGGPTTWRILGAIAAVGLWVRRQGRLAVLVAVAMAGAALLSGLLKVVVDRARPVVPDPVYHAGGGSFPSGHALTSFTALALLVLLVGPHLTRRARALLVAAAALVAVAIGLSRLMLGVHYLTDVLGGWLLAALWLTTVFGAFRLRRVPDQGVRCRPQWDGSQAPEQ